METLRNTLITVTSVINAPVDKVWECFTEPGHIVRWNQASDDWHSPSAENDLRAEGRFTYRMEAKDGSTGFDFSGTYTRVEPLQTIEYLLDDNRRVHVTFEKLNGGTKVVETFEAEQENSIELQRQGWQAILSNFKNYVERTNLKGTMHYEILIDADAETVYNTMLSPGTYSKWTAAFNPASRYEGSWEKGSRIRFIGEDEKGNKGGMVSRIRENIPNRFVSIEHLGMLHDDVEVTTGPEVEKWAGGLENYSFEEHNGQTLVKVDVDVIDEFEAFFEETWPKALKKLKQLCEQEARV